MIILYGWYRDNHYCGRCGRPTIHDNKRAYGKVSGMWQYGIPKDKSAVIVAVTDNDRVLLTKYAGRTYKNYALVAGFNEAGETIEQTVRREVMEEVGLKVKNLKYYKSQLGDLAAHCFQGSSVSLTVMIKSHCRKMNYHLEPGLRQTTLT